MPGAAIGDDDGHAVALATRGRRRSPAPRPRPQAVCAVDGVPRIDDQVDQRDPQPLGVGRRPAAARGRVPGATAGARRDLRGGGRLAAQRVEVRRRQLEPDRPGEVEHLVDDAVQPRDLVVDVGDRFARGASARGPAGAACGAPLLMIISGLRTLVGDDRGQAAERRQPLLLRHLALEPRDRVGQRVERRRQQPRVFVVPAAAARSTIFRVRSPVAATSRITSVMAASGRVMVRATAKLRSVASRTATSAVTASSVVDRPQQAQLFGARPEDQRDGPGARFDGSSPADERQRERDVLTGRQRDVRGPSPRRCA